MDEFELDLRLTIKGLDHAIKAETICAAVAEAYAAMAEEPIFKLDDEPEDVVKEAVADAATMAAVTAEVAKPAKANGEAKPKKAVKKTDNNARDRLVEIARKNGIKWVRETLLSYGCAKLTDLDDDQVREVLAGAV
jgi:hypothetical protein